MVNDSQINLTVISPGNINLFSIRNILTPSTPRSPTIQVNTYSANGYLIDQNTNIVWSVNCTLPCRTCYSNSSTSCKTCYSD